jgi:protein-S-isoprenylcysteine O-methyltransferase Ste14
MEFREMAEAAGSSRLPNLGRRGGGWVVLQVVFLVVAVAAGVLGPAWPPTARPWLAVAGGIAGVAGMGLLVAGGGGLGAQLTPFPRPVDDGELMQDGIYGYVRHPMYGGVLSVLLGWALLSSPVALAPLVLAVAFLEAKRCREEAWLVEQHPEYADYRRRVPRRFVPGVW